MKQNQDEINQLKADIAKLTEENLWLRELIDTLPQTVYETDLRANFTFLNKSAYTLFGYEENEKAIKSPIQVLHPDFIEKGIKNITTVMQGKQTKDTDNEYIVYRKDKTTFPALIQSVPIIKEGQITGIRGFVIDITQHKNYESEIRKTRNSLLSIINSLDTAIITVDENMNISRWNEATKKLLNLEDLDYSGKNVFSVIPMLNTFQHELKYTIHFKKISEDYTLKVEKPLKIVFAITFFPFSDLNEEGAVIRIDDITESVNKNELLIQAQKMESIGTLTGGIAHDFNNVLGGIVGTISLLKLKYKTKDDFEFEEWSRYIHFMEESSRRAVDMVQQLLALSRKREIKPIPLDLNHSVRMVLKLCENSFDKLIKLIPHYTESEMMVFADQTQIEQVILNLCINSYHAMSIMRPDNQIYGELNISFSRMKADKLFQILHPEAIERQEYCIVSVSDNGVGMDHATKEKIFDPFFSTKEKNVGTGLGLAMAYNIIHQHNGFITVYTEKGCGTTFNIYLPAYQAHITETKIKATECILKGQGTILIADDEPIIRELASTFLTECGYKVLTASNGQECLNLFVSFKKEIKAILLDMVMPVKSGYLTFLEIKALDPNTKIILTSGFKNDERILELMKIGADGFIQKPYTVEILSKEIYKIL